MVIDGTGSWGLEITRDMEKKQLSGTRWREYFPALPENLYHALNITASRCSDKKALVDNYKTVCTYKQLLFHVEELAAYLYQEKSVRKGSHVGIMMYNSTEFCVAFLALLRLGAVTVPLPSKFKKTEVLSLAKRADVTFVICDEDYADWFLSVYDPGRLVTVTGIGIRYGYQEVLADWRRKVKSSFSMPINMEEIPGGKGQDTAMIMFTSGTTSQSKGVVLKNDHVMHAVEAYRRTLHITDQDVSVIATPIYHITGLVALLGLFLYVGGTLYLHKFFDAKRLIADARAYGFTFIHASPTVFNLMIQEGEHTPEIPTLRSFACGSSNMMKDKLLRLHRWLPNSSFHTVYGLTETTSPASVFPQDACTSPKIGSSGIPIPGVRFKIVDDEKRELPIGEVGEIAVSGSVVTDSYYKQEADTLKDGWLYTGDLGYFDEQHYLYVVDRKKNMINRGGEKIWCYDVENELTAIEGILDAAVVGIPDDLYGEVAACVVQLKAGCMLTEKGIQDYLRTRIAKYKIPVKIRMVERVPQTPNGKTDKIKIKEMLTEDLHDQS